MALSPEQETKIAAIIADYDAAKTARSLSGDTVLVAINTDHEALDSAVNHSTTGLPATRTRVTALETAVSNGSNDLTDRVTLVEKKLNGESLVSNNTGALPSSTPETTFTISGTAYKFTVAHFSWKGKQYTAAEALVNATATNALRAELVAAGSPIIEEA